MDSKGDDNLLPVPLNSREGGSTCGFTKGLGGMYRSHWPSISLIFLICWILDTCQFVGVIISRGFSVDTDESEGRHPSNVFRSIWKAGSTRMLDSLVSETPHSLSFSPANMFGARLYLSCRLSVAVL